jgi:hypothetical protein
MPKKHERPAEWYWIRGAMGVGVEPGEWFPALWSPSRGVWRSAGFEATAGLVEIGPPPDAPKRTQARRNPCAKRTRARGAA